MCGWSGDWVSSLSRPAVLNNLRTDWLTDWRHRPFVLAPPAGPRIVAPSRQASNQAGEKPNPVRQNKTPGGLLSLFLCFCFWKLGFLSFGNSLSLLLLLLLLSLSLRLVFLFGEALGALTTTTTVTIVIQFREESCARIVCWVGVCMGMGWRKEGRKLDCRTSVCFFSSSLLCICLYLEPWTNITNNASHKTQDVLQYVYVLELYYIQNWAELSCPLMMARRTKAHLDCAILPPCTQKQSIKLPTVMTNLFTSFDLLCTAWSFFLALLENSYASHQKSLLLFLCHKLWS